MVFLVVKGDLYQICGIENIIKVSDKSDQKYLIVVSTISLTFLSNEVFWGDDSFHDFVWMLVEIIAQMEKLRFICCIIVIFNFYILQITASYLVQSGDFPGIHHIDFIKGLFGPAQRRHKIPLQFVLDAPIILAILRL